MPIDDCPHTFADLAATVLPQHMRNLRDAIRTAHPAAIFAQTGVGPVSIARQLGLTRDFSGCYLLLDEMAPIYVGISRSVITRLRQHFMGRTHFDASLAYAIAQHRLPTAGKRSEVMGVPAFRATFSQAQAYLRGLMVSFVEIENPLELYVFEAYAAMELGTDQWNTFRTH